jgi:hypothetical protein
MIEEVVRLSVKMTNPKACRVEEWLGCRGVDTASSCY